MAKSKGNNGVRVISGKWRGRRLPVANSDGLRPTNDRVRETLFNWLMHDLQGVICLDAFAGSGALGIEALSRGAKHVLFAEKDRAVCDILRKSLQLLVGDDQGPIKQCTILQGPIQKHLAEYKHAVIDVVFLDPPFSEPKLLQTVANQLEESCVLAQQALIYIEQGLKDDSFVAPTNWRPIKQGKSGQSKFGLWFRE